jgi:hypothetical protein
MVGKADQAENDKITIPADLIHYAKKNYSQLSEININVSRETEIETYDRALRDILNK